MDPDQLQAVLAGMHELEILAVQEIVNAEMDKRIADRKSFAAVCNLRKYQAWADEENQQQ